MPGSVSAFYVSNVEQYLFGDGQAQAFYENVATLPMDSSSVFIRPYSMRRGGSGRTNALALPDRRVHPGVARRAGAGQQQALACLNSARAAPVIASTT